MVDFWDFFNCMHFGLLLFKKKMKNQKFVLIVCAVLIFILMIISDYNAYTSEMTIVEAKGEVFEKSFSPMWESFVIPLLFIVIAFIPNIKK